MKKTQNPLISIVVIGLNEEKLVRRCMESIAAQNFSNPYEVIFVDGGSKDRTIEIVKEFSSRMNLKIVIHKGMGIGDSREEGFCTSTASIIVSTDSDVILPLDWLSRIYTYFCTHPDCLGVVGPYTIYPSGPLYKYLFVLLVRFWDSVGRMVSGFQAFRGMNFGVRRDAWMKAGGFVRTISALEDVDLALRVSTFGRIHYLSKLIVLTTPRRFDRNILKSTLYRLMAYYHRVFLRDYKYAEWDQIR
jgi:glycosyltransferase involved in cell wall biosynthesis